MKLIITLVVLLAVLAAGNKVSALSPFPLESTDWLSKPITIDVGQLAYSPQIAALGDDVYVVWMDGYGMLFAKSSDGGKTFSAPVRLPGERDASSVVDMNPQIAVRNDNVYVLYSSGRDIFLLRSQDKGDTFADPIIVSNTNPNLETVQLTNHVLSISGRDAVKVAWTTVIGGSAEIFFAHSPDAGASFEPPPNISNNQDGSSIPVISSSGNSVYLAWRDIEEGGMAIHHVSFARSSDGGITFQSTYNLSNNSGIYSSLEHQVAVGSGDTVYVIWRNEIQNGSEVVIARSTDAGRSFDTKVLGEGARPQISVQGEMIYVAWTDLDDRIAFCRSNDGGDHFSEPVVVSKNSFRNSPYDDMPTSALATDGNNVFVAWRSAINETGRDDHEAFLVTSYVAGADFTTEINLSNSTGGDNARPVIIAAPENRMFALWQETERDKVDSVDIKLVSGQIPDGYTGQPTDGGLMTPVSPYNFAIAVAAMGVLLGVAGAFYYVLRKRKTNSTTSR